MLTKLKTCPTCSLALPISNFPKNKSKIDGLSSHCRECKARYQKSWYEKNKERHSARVRERNDRITKENRAYVVRVKMESSCVDCGESNPVVLDFDHVNGDKSYNVGNLAGGAYSLDTVKAEIAKCEVVCSNCHRKRTASRDPRHWAYQSEYL
jgi:hypothetical protein